jgi:NAD(P)-dependent dehydrogenase (short-subunit alcohol dehydrogenase family)
VTYSLAGRGAIITGGNQGLGLEIARAYVRAGANVMVCARNHRQLEAARQELTTLARKEQHVHAMVADVSSDRDVRHLVQRALDGLGDIQILVNNAGVYGPFGSVDEMDWREWEQALAININGSVLPCRYLLPHFKAQRYGKIIQLSGGGATNPLPRILAYAASKAAIVRFAESLALDVQEYGIDVNSIAPGALNTRMMDQLITAGADAVGATFYERMQRVRDEGGTPLETGAALAVFLGAAESDGVTGRLLSAAWDPWDALPAHRDELANSDIYTLRRIVPKDRGKAWGER